MQCEKIKERAEATEGGRGIFAFCVVFTNSEIRGLCPGNIILYFPLIFAVGHHVANGKKIHRIARLAIA